MESSSWESAQHISAGYRHPRTLLLPTPTRRFQGHHSHDDLQRGYLGAGNRTDSGGGILVGSLRVLARDDGSSSGEQGVDAGEVEVLDTPHLGHQSALSPSLPHALLFGSLPSYAVPHTQAVFVRRRGSLPRCYVSTSGEQGRSVVEMAGCLQELEGSFPGPYLHVDFAPTRRIDVRRDAGSHAYQASNVQVLYFVHRSMTFALRPRIDIQMCKPWMSSLKLKVQGMYFAHWSMTFALPPRIDVQRARRRDPFRTCGAQRCPGMSCVSPEDNEIRQLRVGQRHEVFDSLGVQGSSRENLRKLQEGVSSHRKRRDFLFLMANWPTHGKRRSAVGLISMGDYACLRHEREDALSRLCD
ncbi:hypothetical protein ARMGADRAFT_1026422 [Armillaria gallica]|uniref:Uncharacterized protein n=1 Tax=Armillaria gallica TaxID=47427 RepID=A0A2H3DT63_ARMGA|nr:hypothetical protein ARMGADRAFT_1026422 [Armillaria gallica]